MSLVTLMIRMDICTGKSAYESSHETPVACPAGMNAETYDTEAVPYDKQQRAESENSTFHTNMQSYKNHSKCKRQYTIKKRPASVSDTGLKEKILSHVEYIFKTVVSLIHCINKEFLAVSAVKIFEVNLMEAFLKVCLSCFFAEAVRTVIICD